jgi:hypothetical protein
VIATSALQVCDVCGVPTDAGFFDDSRIVTAPALGERVVLARYELHRNYCGVLVYFAQLAERAGSTAAPIETPGYRWEIRCAGQPRFPYTGFEHVVNPWGLSGFPVHLRLEEGCTVELVVRNLNVTADEGDDVRRLAKVGGRLLGRYWYNAVYGGAPQPL